MAQGRRRGRPRAPLSTGVISASITEAELASVEEPPGHLNMDGQAMWYRLLVFGREFLNTMDVAMVAETAEIFQRKERLRRCLDLGIYPEIFISPQKRPEVHPARKLLEADSATLAANLQILGFAPMERKKLDLQLTQAIDPVLALLEKEAEMQSAMKDAWESYVNEDEEEVAVDSE